VHAPRQQRPDAVADTQLIHAMARH
jgi:hypothetical protein